MFHPFSIFKNILTNLIDFLNSLYYRLVYFPLTGVVFKWPSKISWGGLVDTEKGAKFVIGKNSVISGKVFNYGSLEVGENVVIGKDSEFIIHRNAKLKIGEYSRFNGTRLKCAKNIKIGALVRTIDIMPTILDYVNIPIPPTINGKSLVPVIEKKEKTGRVAFSEGGFFDGTPRVVSIRTKKFKLIKNFGSGKYEFFDLEKDPWEKKNLAEEKEKPKDFHKLKKKIDEYVAQGIEESRKKAKEDVDSMEKLKGLGYI